MLTILAYNHLCPVTAEQMEMFHLHKGHQYFIFWRFLVIKKCRSDTEQPSLEHTSVALWIYRMYITAFPSAIAF